MSDRVCIKCKLSKPVDEFGYKDKAKGLVRSYCKLCQRAYSQKHYLANRPTLIGKAAIRNKEERKTKRELIAEMKSQPCKDCGNSFPWYCMEFDHRNPEEKTEDIGILKNQSRGMPSFLAELAKCDLVCANCHRARTHNRGVRPERILEPSPL